LTKRLWRMGLDGDRIWIKLDGYDPGINKVLKAELPGPPRWDGIYKRWLFPTHWDTCLNARKVANRFDAELRINTELRTWALEEKARQEQIPDVQSMDLTDLPTVREGYAQIWDAISARPFQTVGAAFAARNGSCLIADQPGLGKTVQSIAAVIEAGITGPILVVAPKAAAKLTWPQELTRWVPGDDVRVIGAHLKPHERANDILDVVNYEDGDVVQRRWIITSPNYLRIKAETDDYGNYVKYAGQKKMLMVGEAVEELFNVEWSAVIVDESHQTLAGATGNKKKQSAQRQGLGALDIADDGLRIALSGTPFRGKEEYLWGQLNFLRPDLYRSYWRWIEKFFDTHQDRYGMVIGNIVDRKALYQDAANVMIRRTKEEVAKDLPPKMYGGQPLDDTKGSPVAVWLDMEGKQATAYEQMVKKAQAELEGGILQTTGVLAELIRLKQFAGSYGQMLDNQFSPTLPSNKFDWLVEFLDERGISKDLDKDAPKVVIASQFSKLIDVMGDGLKELGIHGYKFTGATSDKQREYIKDQWQNDPADKHRVLLLTTTAGGVSLTLDAASELVILDETWNTSDQEQLEDRLHRLSRIHQVTIWNVRSRNTIEESIARANQKQEFSLKGIMDGSRGVDFMKELLV
jgi:SNF2 family DNA or RNA helicase